MYGDQSKFLFESSKSLQYIMILQNQNSLFISTLTRLSLWKRGDKKCNRGKLLRDFTHSDETQGRLLSDQMRDVFTFCVPLPTDLGHCFSVDTQKHSGLSSSIPYQLQVSFYRNYESCDSGWGTIGNDGRFPMNKFCREDAPNLECKMTRKR